MRVRSRRHRVTPEENYKKGDQLGADSEKEPLTTAAPPALNLDNGGAAQPEPEPQQEPEPGPESEPGAGPEPEPELALEPEP